MVKEHLSSMHRDLGSTHSGTRRTEDIIQPAKYVALFCCHDFTPRPTTKM